MFATRRDQENLSHLHQNTAAAKPLNHNATKTPGPRMNAPKTPYKRNDENQLHTVSKNGAGKAAANLFVTPAPNKTRAVLGAKTTNAKALATPGQGLKTTQKPLAPPPSTQKVSPRLKRNRVRIHQAPEIKEDANADDSAPEVEYCPPPSIRTPPLPDYPDDIHELPLKDIFSHEAIMASIFRAPSPDRDENGLTARDRSDRANIRRLDEQITRNIQTARARSKMTNPQHAPRPVSTLSARSAAAALSSARAAPAPSFAAPTKSARARTAATEGTSVSKNFANAAVASRTTVGYARGRQVSATKRPPLSNAHRTPVVKASPAHKAARPRAIDVLGLSDSDEDEAQSDAEDLKALEKQMREAACEDFVLEL